MNNAETNKSRMVARATALLEGMQRRDYKIATEHFDATMSSVMPGVKLEELWSDILDEAGHFEGNAGVRTDTIDGRPVVYITCQFEKGTADMGVVFDEHANVAGLSFTPRQGEDKEEEEEEAKPPAKKEESKQAAPPAK